jgi:hypothetical protein
MKEKNRRIAGLAPYVSYIHGGSDWYKAGKVTMRFVSSLISCLILVSSLFGQANQPSDPPEKVYVSSWRCRNSVLPTTQFDLKLGSSVNHFSKILSSDDGRQFRLLIEHNVFGNLSLDNWYIQLSDLSSPKDLQRDLLRDSISTSIAPGVIYPRLQPLVFDYQGPTWGDGYHFFYIKTVRLIRVDDFVVGIKVNSIKWKNFAKDKVAEVQVNISIDPWKSRTDQKNFPSNECRDVFQK